MYRFFKVILAGTLEEKKLMIPVNFAKQMGRELADVATLIDPNGLIWKVHLTKNGENVWFDCGWNEFAQYYSISAGYFVVFEYKKNTTFHVIILNLTGEINYPCKAGSGNDMEHDFVEQIESDVDTGYDISGLLEELGICFAQKWRNFTREESNRVTKAARSLKLKNPSFMVIVQSIQLRRRAMYVPAKFAKEFVSKDTKSVQILISSGRKLMHHVSWAKTSGFSFTLGMLKKYKKLKEGDICIFELIRSNDFLLKLHIFHK